MNDLFKQAQKIQEDLVAWRRYLHQCPEVGIQLPKTVAFVTEKLQEMGYETQSLGGGVVAQVGKKPGKCFLLRADMDGLPIQEQTEEKFCSFNGNMHACGHDFHTVMLLGAARLLKENEDKINGCIKLMFQPGEEVLLGAKAMIAEGLLKSPRVDAAMMLHVATGMPIPAGHILIPAGGSFTSASDWFKIRVRGKGGHGAMPEGTIDPLNVLSHLHISLQEIISREISSSDSVVLTVGIMRGGTASNIIPDTAEMEGTLRTYDPQVREFVVTRIKEISQYVGLTFRAGIDVDIEMGCPAISISSDVSSAVRKSLTELVGAGAISDSSHLGARKMGGSEDFSFISQKVPALMLLLSAGCYEDGYLYPAHHPKARFDESVLARGAAIYAASGLGWLQQQQ